MAIELKDITDIRKAANSVIVGISRFTRLGTNFAKFDYRFANPAVFKPNDMGFPVNNWIRISNKNVKTQSFANKTKIYLKDLVTESETVFGKNLIPDDYIDILLFNVYINTTKTPRVIVNEVKGMDNGTIKQIFTPGDYDITISGVLSSPYSFQPDTYSIGWHFNEKFHGKGYAKESAYTFIDYLFEKLRNYYLTNNKIILYGINYLRRIQ